MQGNQAKSFGFPWIPLAELGLFNGLWRIQIKKLPRAELAFQIVLPTIPNAMSLPSPEACCPGIAFCLKKYPVTYFCL
jgi:hypothetical protein